MSYLSADNKLRIWLEMSDEQRKLVTDMNKTLDAAIKTKVKKIKKEK